jgi:hypothetical protein
VKPETKFWKEVKKNLPDIDFTRLESWASFGVPEVKTDAPRSVKLYESSAVTESGLSLVRSRACALDDWTAIRARLLGL